MNNVTFFAYNVINNNAIFATMGIFYKMVYVTLVKITCSVEQILKQKQNAKTAFVSNAQVIQIVINQIHFVVINNAYNV